jgi:hypothetical protein
MSLAGIFLLIIIFVPPGEESAQGKRRNISPLSSGFSDYTYMKWETLCSKNCVTPIWEFRIILPLSYLGKSQKSAKFD